MKGALGFIGVFLSFLCGKCVVSLPQLQMPALVQDMQSNSWAKTDMSLCIEDCYYVLYVLLYNLLNELNYEWQRVLPELPKVNNNVWFKVF